MQMVMEWKGFFYHAKKIFASVYTNKLFHLGINNLHVPSNYSPIVLKSNSQQAQTVYPIIILCYSINKLLCINS